MKKLLFVIVILFSLVNLSWDFTSKDITNQTSESSFNKIEIDSLIYQKWILKKLNGKEDVKEKAGKDIPYLEFHLNDKSVSGYTGCNSLNGKALITEDEISFSGMSTTKMMCRNNKFGRYEQEIKEIIFYEAPLKYKIDSGVLSIYKDGAEVMFLERDITIPATESLLNKIGIDTLIYQKWMLKKLNGKDDARVKAGDEIPYLEFHLKDNKLTGYTGCNSANGTASITENEITFSDMTTTKRGCKDMDYDIYEMDFKQIIFYKEPLRYKIDNGILAIFKGDKEVMVLEVDRPKSQVIDIDGNKYKTVIISTLEWMSENLNVEHYRNGDVIPQVQSKEEWINLTTGAWCYYENNSENGKTYGKLYNWYAVNDQRGLAPEGWHIPSDKEFQILLDFSGGIDNAGDKLKSTIGWRDNYNGTNSSGFNGLPGGERPWGGSFCHINEISYWWSSTQSGGIFAYYFCLEVLGAKSIGIFHQQSGYYIRCVKN